MSTRQSFALGFKVILLIVIGLFGIFQGNVAFAYTSQTTYYSQKAVSYVKNQISRLEKDDYTDEEILDELIRMKKNYVSRQRSSLYSGRSTTEVSMIITELGNAISWYSERVNDGSYYHGYYPQNRDYSYSYGYTNSYNYNNSYYQNNQRSISNQTLRVSDSYFSTNSSTSTDLRTNITRDNTYSYEDYDMYTFVLQGNGIRNNTPESTQFLPTSFIREVSSSQGGAIRISFGAEYRSDVVRSIKMAAQNAYRTSQVAVSLGTSFSDMYTSLSGDDFRRQAVSNGNNQTYTLYKLYVARDDSEAFLVEYRETRTGWNNYYPNYQWNNGNYYYYR